MDTKLEPCGLCSTYVVNSDLSICYERLLSFDYFGGHGSAGGSGEDDLAVLEGPSALLSDAHG